MNALFVIVGVLKSIMCNVMTYASCDGCNRPTTPSPGHFRKRMQNSFSNCRKEIMLEMNNRTIPFKVDIKTNFGMSHS